MKLKNKIVIGLCMALAMVSFLHPFSGEVVCAEPTEEQTEETMVSAEVEATPEEVLEESLTEEVSMTEEAALEENEADEEGHISFPDLPDVEGYDFDGWETEDGKVVDEESFEIPMLMSIAARASSAGISATAPEAGQENKYEYSGSDVTWTVPASGYYDLYCYGAQGGTGGYDRGVHDAEDSYANAGSKGVMRGARAYLEKGTELVIRTGQMPADSSCSYGEGSTSGETWWPSGSQSINGYQISYSETLRWGTKETGSSCGSRTLTRGYPDGGYGNSLKTVCDTDKNHSGGAVGGGGGGSSYILCGGTKIMSAKGGTGGTAHYECSDGEGTAAGGSGGGVTTLAAAEGVTWYTNELDKTESSSNSGHGYVLIRVVNVSPIISLSASTGEITKENVILTVTIESEGQGLTGNYVSWEKDASGNDIWTNSLTYAVYQNGIYTCKVKDSAGNTTEAMIEVSNIDRQPPTGKITADKTEWTNENVTLTVTGEDAEATETDAKSGMAERAYAWEKDADGNDIWTNTTGYVAEQNGTYSCKIKDEAGNETICEYIVSNIDRTAPEVTYEYLSELDKGKVTLTWKGNDIQPDGSSGCGLPIQAYSFDGITFSAENKLEITKEGIYQVWVRDRLGNVKISQKEISKKEISRDTIKKESVKEKTTELTKGVVDEIKTLEIPPVTEWKGELMSKKEENKNTVYNQKEKEVKVERNNSFFPEEEITGQQPIITERKEQELIEKEIPQIHELKAEPLQKEINLKRIVLYSVWMVTVLCGLLWILFCLLFEHVEVYQKDDKGKYYKIGRCAIIRKKEYIQINLICFMKKQERKDYMLRFSKAYVWLHKKEKVLVRTAFGVELRNVAKKIEILCCD